MLVERRRHADGDEIRLVNFGKIRGGAELSALHKGAQVFVDYVADIVLAAVDFVDLLRLNIKAGDRIARLGLLDRERQANIAQPDHADRQRAVSHFLQQFCFHTHLFPFVLQRFF